MRYEKLLSGACGVPKKRKMRKEKSEKYHYTSKLHRAGYILEEDDSSGRFEEA